MLNLYSFRYSWVSEGSMADGSKCGSCRALQHSLGILHTRERSVLLLASPLRVAYRGKLHPWTRHKITTTNAQLHSKPYVEKRSRLPNNSPALPMKYTRPPLMG